MFASDFFVIYVQNIYSYFSQAPVWWGLPHQAKQLFLKKRPAPDCAEKKEEQSISPFLPGWTPPQEQVDRRCTEPHTIRSHPLMDEPLQRQYSLPSTELRRCLEYTAKQVGRTWNVAVAVKVPVGKEYLWGALTDYDNLQTFIPGLQENVCTQRSGGGCTLKQVATERVAAVPIRVETVLRVQEHKGGLRCEGAYTDFPAPPRWSEASEPWDISFQQLKGDFQMFNGVWRMQDVEPGVSGSVLSYHVLVVPRLFPPMRLIQGIIERKICMNLDAVCRYAMRVAIESRLSVSLSS